MSSRRLILRRKDVCSVCGCALAAGEPGWWDKAARTVTCSACHDALSAGAAPSTSEVALDTGVAGASAAREHERRRRLREQGTRERNPHIGGALLRLRGTPQHEEAWARGAAGEEQVAASLEERLAGTGVVLVHDRRVPGTRANIDHLAIAPDGVFVIDAKAVSGKVRIETPWFGEQRLLVDGRDRSKLLDGLDRQIAAVRAALGPEHDHLPVRGVLCFTEADLPLLQRRARGHLLLYRRGLAKELSKGGALGTEGIAVVAQVLAERLPAA